MKYTTTSSSASLPKNAKHLYEEAAFAAMVETMKRKDEAMYGSNDA